MVLHRIAAGAVVDRGAGAALGLHDHFARGRLGGYTRASRISSDGMSLLGFEAGGLVLQGLAGDGLVYAGLEGLLRDVTKPGTDLCTVGAC